MRQRDGSIRLEKMGGKNMPIAHTDLIAHIPDEYGQALLSGLTFTDTYTLERFVFDILGAYAKAQTISANSGGESLEFVKPGTASLLTETDDGDYTFTKTFTVSGTVKVGVDGFTPSKGSTVLS